MFMFKRQFQFGSVNITAATFVKTPKHRQNPACNIVIHGLRDVQEA